MFGTFHVIPENKKLPEYKLNGRQKKRSLDKMFQSKILKKKNTPEQRKRAFSVEQDNTERSCGAINFSTFHT